MGLGAIASVAESEPRGGIGSESVGSGSNGGTGSGIGSANNVDDQTPQPTTTAATSASQWQWGDPFTESGLEIADYGWFETEFGNIGVGGYATNVTDSTIGYAQIEGKFYDFSGAVIGSSLANINDLGPGQTWNFEITYLDIDTENVDSFSFGEVTAF